MSIQSRVTPATPESPSAAPSSLLRRREGEIDLLQIHRPERLNALDAGLIEALLQYFEARRRDRSVRVILMSGAGRGFCSGADLKDGGDNPFAALGEGDWMLRDVLRAMRACPQPLIGLVHGPAAGGGLALALACDLLLAGTSARFIPAFLRVGLSGSELGVGWRLQRSIGIARTREMLFANRSMAAAEALAAGLVSQVVSDEALEPAGLQLAREMLQSAPDALRLTKRSLDAALECTSLDAMMEQEERAQILSITRGQPKPVPGAAR